MEANQSNQRESDFKQLKELFPDIDSFQSTVDYLLTIVPQSSTGTTTSSKSNQISDELIAKAIQQILSRSEEPSADNIEKEIEKLRGGTLKKEDISKDEMVAQAIQTLLNRNEEITESNIEKEIQQIQADILLAHQIQFGGNSYKRSGDHKKEYFSEMAKEIEKPSEIAVGIENFFRDVGEGIKSTVASITEFVESRLEKNEEIAPDAEERLQLLNDKEVELEETLQSETVDLEESFLDGTNLAEPINLKTGSLVFRESIGD